MKSTFNRLNYTVQLDGELPRRFSKKQTDEAIKHLEEMVVHFRALCAILDENDDIRSFFDNTLYVSGTDGYDDDTRWRVRDLEEKLKDIKAQLQQHDDIRPVEEQYTLEDLGYRRVMPSRHLFYEKVLSDTAVAETVEEIQMVGQDMIRRLRKIEWDVYPGGRSSKSIVYQPLRMTKMLRYACENTLSQQK